MTIQFRYIGLGLLAGLSAISQTAIADSETKSFSRQMLLNKPVTLPSKNMATHVLRVRFPKGFKTPLHTHEGPGPRYVINGKLRVVDGGENKIFGPGEVFWETGAEMTVENVGDGDAEMIIFEMVPAK